MMKINPDEILIEGKWVKSTNNQIVGDAACNRVEELVRDYLVRLTSDKSGWDTLYQDPADKRFWEHIYLQSWMHGGGPPTIRNITQDEARQKYGV